MTVTDTEMVSALGWRIEGSWVIIDNDGRESGEAISLDDLRTIWQAAQPKWVPAEWQQDETILRKYALDGNGNVFIMDLPPLP